MNHFEAIQQKVTTRKQEMTKNIVQPSNAIKKMANQEKEQKKDYMFSLYPSDREKLNELAKQAGYVTPQGRPNASAFFTALIRQL
ncbi:hypothetical protein ACJX4K_002701 [Enterococcus faecalis]|uniref:hypothetical protein n=1 Tax=Enterococcus faecalis TaxID=1351 RepID=UPI001E316989|nr:hypothetical protein [Enterococcus faecalis]EKZ0143896.1 hypothetical protein [Enterococcus faecalis]MCD5180710.1 hypothetical protein [Enterococcus faecalis]